MKPILKQAFEAVVVATITVVLFRRASTTPVDIKKELLVFVPTLSFHSFLLHFGSNKGLNGREDTKA